MGIKKPALQLLEIHPQLNIPVASTHFVDFDLINYLTFKFFSAALSQVPSENNLWIRLKFLKQEVSYNFYSLTSNTLKRNIFLFAHLDEVQIFKLIWRNGACPQQLMIKDNKIWRVSMFFLVSSLKFEIGILAISWIAPLLRNFIKFEIGSNSKSP